MSVIEHGRWRIEPSKEGIPLVFGDGKYPQDPPRIASELESSLADAYAGAVAAIEHAIQAADWEPGDAQRALQGLRDWHVANGGQ